MVQGGESYTALAQSLPEALQKLGGCTKEQRTDSLSAAFKNLESKAQKDTTIRYGTLCQHNSMMATRNNRRQGHENGSVESSMAILNTAMSKLCCSEETVLTGAMLKPFVLSVKSYNLYLKSY